MQSSGIPVKFAAPFAHSAGGGYISTPVPATTGASGRAALDTGFPPVCFTPAASGGIPPAGKDFNGLFYQITSWDQWFAAGGPVPFDSTFATTIGGYPKGAILIDNSYSFLYLNTSENNTTDPNASGAGWTVLNAVADGSVTTAKLAAHAVSNAKLAQMAAATLKGNNTGGTADAADLTVSQVLALLNISGTIPNLNSAGHIRIGAFLINFGTLHVGNITGAAGNGGSVSFDQAFGSGTPYVFPIGRNQPLNSTNGAFAVYVLDGSISTSGCTLWAQEWGTLVQDLYIDYIAFGMA